MDEKNKNEENIESKEENKVEEQKKETSKKDKEKNKLGKSQEEQLKDVEKELKNMIEDMKVVMGDNVPEIKVMAIGPKEKKKILMYQIIEAFISIIVLIALIGYLDWIKSEKLYQFFIFAGGLVLIEFMLSYVINRFFLKYVIYSFGTLPILATIISFVICLLFAPGITIVSFWKVILAFLLYLIVKKITMFFIKGNRSFFRRV